jgi:hypothetical protein
MTTAGAKSALNLKPKPRWPAHEVAWFRFDDPSGAAAKDGSGNGNDGVIHGAAARVTGEPWGAIQLDGIHGWADGPARTLPAAEDPLTFSAWIQVKATRNDFTGIFQYGYPEPNSSGPFHSEFIAQVRPDGRWETGSTGSNAPLVGSPVADGRWHHIAVRYDAAPADTATLYTDGREETNAKWNRQPGAGSNRTWVIGQFALLPATFFHGAIGDIRIYRRGLTAHQINAIYRCSSSRDADPYYFVPLYGSVVEASANSADGAVDSLRETLRDPGRDFAGATFARRVNSCSLPWIESADVGQNIQISAELLVPGDSAGHHTQAGPFFHSRLAAPGDGIFGGTSAGYWVALDSNATVTVRRLNPLAVVAFASIPGFDSSVHHRLEAVAVGQQLQVKLDGRLLEFEQEGKTTSIVTILPVWNGPPAIGANQGGAGIEFGAVDSRGMIGGQEARRIRISPAASLW